MSQQILVIHGGNAFLTYDEYLSYLKSKELSLEKLRFKDWKRNLADVLGKGYDVFAPQMPNSQNARYSEWKIWFEKIIPLLNEPIILIGHSLGGIFLAKYLSENNFPKNVKATFLVAAPYNTEEQHPLVDFNILGNLSGLIRQGGDIFVYQSKDDQVVPFTNVLDYQKRLPNAHVRIFEDRQHFNQAEFPEIVDDIKSLK
ncbi:MAG: alpha/beta fold hydrolase [Candidatus Paceibacterota bacterium]|jgi:hypothetical protein